MPRSKDWATTVLRAAAADHERTAVQGPLSLFVNLRGTSEVHVERRAFVLRPGMFALVNRAQEFSLQYGKSGAKSLNVHFADSLVSETLHAMEDPSDLDPNERPNFTMLSVLRTQSLSLASALSPLRSAMGIQLEEATVMLLREVLRGSRHRFGERMSLRALRETTRQELWQRINRAVDYMHAHFDQALTLERLAKVGCLSRYHFLRRFKEMLGVTPAAYLTRLRLSIAATRVAQTDQTLEQIAPAVGFSSQSALSRAYLREHGQPLSVLR